MSQNSLHQDVWKKLAVRKEQESDSGNRNTSSEKTVESLSRPKNSYLKLILHDEAWEKLYQMALQVRDESNILSDHNSCADVSDHTAVNQDFVCSDTRVLQDSMECLKDPEVIPISTPMSDAYRIVTKKSARSKHARQVQRPCPRFQPRSKSSLHATFFFGGPVLCQLPPDELEEWHKQIKERLEKVISRYYESDGNIIAEEDNDTLYSISFQRLRLFPPKRRDLVIAEFEASPSLDSLYEDSKLTALNSKTTNNMLAQTVQRNFQRWVVHVTLGDLSRGWRQSDLQRLESILTRIGSQCEKPYDLCSSSAILGENTTKIPNPGRLPNSNDSFCPRVLGITMGGPCPQQKELDWEFRFNIGASKQSIGCDTDVDKTKQ